MKAVRHRPVQPLSIRIGVVSVDGVAMTAAQTRQFRSAIQAELHRLAEARQPRAWTSMTLASEPAPQVRLQAPGRVRELGTEVGRSLWSAIGGVR